MIIINELLNNPEIPPTLSLFLQPLIKIFFALMFLLFSSRCKFCTLSTVYFKNWRHHYVNSNKGTSQIENTNILIVCFKISHNKPLSRDPTLNIQKRALFQHTLPLSSRMKRRLGLLISPNHAPYLPINEFSIWIQVSLYEQRMHL